MAEANTKLGILVQVKDEATRALQRLGDDVRGLGFELDNAGIAGGVLAGSLAAIAGSAIVSGVKAFADAEAQMLQFDAILATLPPHLQEYRDELLAAADKAVKLGFDNELAAVSLARLLQATGDINLTMQGFQAAMDLARFKGIGLEEATRALILALQGSPRILKEFGIEIDEHASKQTILAAVMKATAGQAEAYSKSFYGIFDVFKQIFGEVLEMIGEPIVARLEILSNAFISRFGTDIPSSLKRFEDEIQNFVLPAIIGLGAEALFLAGKFIWGISMIKAAVLAFFGPAGLLVAIITAFLAWFILNWDTNIKGISSMFDWLGEKIGSWTETIKSYFAKLNEVMDAHAQSIRDSVGGAFDWIRGRAGDALNWIGDKIAWIVTQWNNMIGLISAPIKAAGSAIKNAIPFADGGIVTSPTLGLVGEAGPEAIIPLNRLGGVGGVTITISGNTFMSEENFMQMMDRAVAKVIKYQIRVS
jgi:hypothetical protein